MKRGGLAYGKLWTMVLLGFLLFYSAGCTKKKDGDTGSATENNVIKVGAAHAVTGPIALYGEPIVNGIKLAIKQVNSSAYIGEGRSLELVVEDTMGDKKQAISAFEKLIKQDKVAAILGPTLSNSAFARRSHCPGKRDSRYREQQHRQRHNRYGEFRLSYQYP